MEFEYPRKFKSENYARRDSSSYFRRRRLPTSVLFMKIQVPNLIGIGERSRLRFDIVPQFINRAENGSAFRIKVSRQIPRPMAESIDRKFCVISTRLRVGLCTAFPGYFPRGKLSFLPSSSLSSL